MTKIVTLYLTLIWRNMKSGFHRAHKWYPIIKKVGWGWRNPFGEQEDRYDPEFREETNVCSVWKFTIFLMQDNIFDIFKVVVFSLSQENPKIVIWCILQTDLRLSILCWKVFVKFSDKNGRVGPKPFLCKHLLSYLRNDFNSTIFTIYLIYLTSLVVYKSKV